MRVSVNLYIIINIMCFDWPTTLDAWSRSAGATACETCVAGTYANSSGVGRGAVKDWLF